MIDYWINYHDKLIQATIEHVQLAGISLLTAIAISGAVVYFLISHTKFLDISIYVFSIIYSIPSLALFALLIPVTGLGRETAILALIIYAQYILLRSFATGIREVDPSTVEVAIAMGMNKSQVMKKVQLPLSARTLFGGIRIAATSTIGIATIGATINAGGLGTILFDGLRTFSLIKLAWGTLLTAGLCMIVNFILLIAEHILLERR